MFNVNYQKFIKKFDSLRRALPKILKKYEKTNKEFKLKNGEKKPSFLNKKKKKHKSELEEELEGSEGEEAEYVTENISEEKNSINQTLKEISEINKKMEEIDKKEESGIKRANKEVLKARGIYRKRKKYQGNAKLANREKYYKKMKQRKNFVKNYEGKPDVYSGEETGLRRDLIRSRQFK